MIPAAHNMAEANYFGIMIGMCFGYSLIDVLLIDAKDCMGPMRGWMVVSYIIVAVFKSIQKLGQKYSHAGENFIFTFRQKSNLALGVVCVIWMLLVPFFAVWTAMGTHWFRKTLAKHPSCMSQGVHPWLVIFWQLLCYIWILIYAVYFGISCVIEKRTRQAELNMRQIETADSIARWGRLTAPAPDIASLGAQGVLKGQQGLQPQEIQCLPCEQIVDQRRSACPDMHCPICLGDFVIGDTVRTLPTCAHSFHQSCVDLWLLRRADCPMCKCQVRGAVAASV